MLNVKEDYGSPQWFADQLTASSTITTSSSCNSYSPLNEYPAAGIFFQPEEEELMSISSLDNGSHSSYNAPVPDDDDELFPDFPVYQPRQQQPVVPVPEASQQSSSLSPTYHEPAEQEIVLLESVVKSKIDELAGELEVDMSEMASPAGRIMAGTSSPTTGTSKFHRQQMNSSSTVATMPPPPPLPSSTGFFSTPVPDSLPTIRSFNFQQPIPQFPLPLAFGGWNTPTTSSAYGWPHQQQPQVIQVQPQDPQVQLVQLLILCAQKVAIEDLDTARVILAGLKQLTSPEGTPMERLASYFAEALAAKIDNNTSGSVFKGLVSDSVLESDEGMQSSLLEAFSAFYDNLPIGKFDHLTMNQVILDCVERERSIHILDLHLWIGTQWPAFLHALATRPNGPPKVTITALGTSERDLQETGRKLKECAQMLKVQLVYRPLMVKNLVEEFTADMVQLQQGEAFVVNSLSKFHYLLAEESPAVLGRGAVTSKFSKFLLEIRKLAPKVLVMAENDANHNSPNFLNRFGECLKYYSAVFDAMATCANSPLGRTKMERLFAASKIRNIVACEGRARVERHESMAEWVRRLESVGFRPHHLSPRAVNQAKLLLRLYYTNGYTLHSERGYLVLGWRSLPLNTVSAWRI